MTELPRGFRDLAYRVLDQKIDTLQKELDSYCESPIEVAFGVAFMILGEMSYDAPIALYEPKHPSVADLFNKKTIRIVLETQKQIGDYRVDFLASYLDIRERVREIVVECDGHAFHERTKEQALRDRSRDRQLQGDGRKVFRFTGSELYRDAFACAEEVLESLVMGST